MEHPLMTIGEIVILSLLTLATTVELIWQLFHGATFTVVAVIFLLAYIFGDLTYCAIRDAVRNKRN